MKTKIFSLLVFFLPFLVKAQSCYTISCSNQIIKMPIPQNMSYDGSYCVVGKGTIGTSNNFNNWTYMVFNGNDVYSTDSILICSQTLNMNTGRKVYTTNAAKVELTLGNWNGSDSVFVNCPTVLHIQGNVNNSGSTGYTQCVVLLAPGITSVTIDGTVYKNGDIYKSVAGNTSNWLYIKKCSGSIILADPPQKPSVTFTESGDMNVVFTVDDDPQSVDYYLLDIKTDNWMIKPRQIRLTPGKKTYLVVIPKKDIQSF